MDRVNKLKYQLKIQKLEALLITNVAEINYLTGYGNFSSEEREAWLVITPKDQYLLTDGRYTTAIKKQVKHFKLIEISGNNSLQTIFKNLNAKHNVKIVGVDFADISHVEYKNLKKVFPKIKHLKLKQRIIKDETEIAKIQQSCLLGDQVFEYILTKIKTGVTEQDLSLAIELFVKKHRAKLAFDTIVAFGANSAVPHHQAGESILGPSTGSGQKGQFVLFDFGTSVKGYCSDMTRTVFFGKPTTAQIKIYETVKYAQALSVEFIQRQLDANEKIKASDVDKIAREYITSCGYESIPHSLGHGIGLKVHEAPSLSPKSKDYLAAGMVFSIEPGIYIPGFGGVRIEDLYTIAEGKIRQLTKSSKEIIIIN